MVSQYAVRDLLITCVEDLKICEEMFEFLDERYSKVLDDTTTRDRFEVCRCLNAANAFTGMARQCFLNGDTRRTKGYIENAFNCLERVAYLQ